MSYGSIIRRSCWLLIVFLFSIELCFLILFTSQYLSGGTYDGQKLNLSEWLSFGFFLSFYFMPGFVFAGLLQSIYATLKGIQTKYIIFSAFFTFVLFWIIDYLIPNSWGMDVLGYQYSVLVQVLIGLISTIIVGFKYFRRITQNLILAVKGLPKKNLL